jgi:pimeloyl-ACP methyl ester carboxylesterase
MAGEDMKKKGLIYRGELLTLDENSRLSAPGQFAELPDGFVHFEIAGPSEAQAVVLIPGLSVPFSIWDPTFKALVEARFRVLRYDLYGRGFSDRPDARYDQALFDRQLRNLLDFAGIKKPVDLVGLSMGGAIAIHFANDHPDMVRRLCLIDPAGLPWKQPLTARLAQAPVIGNWIMGLMGNKVLISNLEDYFYGDRGYSELVREFQIQMQYAGFKKSILASLRSGITTGAEKAYENVGRRDLPTLLIWGREDHVVPFELSKRVRELMPNIEFHAIEKAAHIPHYERPEVVSPLLLDFLSK